MLVLKKDVANIGFYIPLYILVLHSAIDAAREKPSRKRSLETDSEVSEKVDDEYAYFKRFLAVPKHKEFKWDIPENLVKYTNDHFNKFT